MELEFCAILTEMVGRPVEPNDHFFGDAGADSMVLARFCARVRTRDDLPRVAMTDVYAHPTARDLATAVPVRAGTAAPVRAGAAAEVADRTATVLAGYRAVLGEILGAEVAPDAHVFTDLGADSMTMTRFCARVRRRDDLPDVAMTDVYAHPTAAGLASALASAPTGAVPAGAGAPVEGPVRTGSTRAYLLCGAAQFVTFVAFTLGYGALMGEAYLWIVRGATLVELYLRGLVAVSISFAVFAVVPVLAKWLLIGRWTEREIPLWGPAYFRFWLARTLVRANPLMLVAPGSPLLPLYLRALGAKIGPGVVLLSRTVPVCPDLLTIGARSTVRKDALVPCYRAEPGRLRLGRVTIGSDVVIGEATVVDIDTAIGDGARLAHSSSVHEGQRIPAGDTWWGTPARPGGSAPGMPGDAHCGPVRRIVYGLGQLLMLVGVWLPLGAGVIDSVLTMVPTLETVLGPGVAELGAAALYVELLVTTGGLLLVGLLVGFVMAAGVPRLLALGLTEGRTYPLYGRHYTLHRMILRMTNIKTFMHLLGDSSYIVGYLRSIGYDLRLVPQTGTNFGTAVKHETPFASSIGTGTMIADGLSLINSDYSDSAFRIIRTRIGSNSFFGNRIAYPADSRVGDDCLLATKTLVPTDGPVRSGVGLLGSPPFEIPRTVSRDGAWGHLHSGLDLHQRLRGKDRYNRRTVGVALLVRWGALFGIALLTVALADVLVPLGSVALGIQLLVSLVFTMVYTVLVERASTLWRPLRPRLCSVYEPYFWWHERYWKLVVSGWDTMLAGTPFKNVVSRALGVRIGRRVFDDGCGMTDRTLVTVGDDVVLNAGSTIQCHSQEDGTFKSDHATLGSGVCLEVGAFVHYGVRIGDGARIGCDAFLMKGEEVPAGAFWAGNPAREAERPAAPPTAAGPATPVPATPVPATEETAR